jgi:hypothetical protein
MDGRLEIIYWGVDAVVINRAPEMETVPATA